MQNLSRLLPRAIAIVLLAVLMCCTPLSTQSTLKPMSTAVVLYQVDDCALVLEHTGQIGMITGYQMFYSSPDSIDAALLIDAPDTVNVQMLPVLNQPYPHIDGRTTLTFYIAVDVDGFFALCRKPDVAFIVLHYKHSGRIRVVTIDESKKAYIIRTFFGYET